MYFIIYIFFLKRFYYLYYLYYILICCYMVNYIIKCNKIKYKPLNKSFRFMYKQKKLNYIIFFFK
jgi:hypothetical protein